MADLVVGQAGAPAGPSRDLVAATPPGAHRASHGTGGATLVEPGERGSLVVADKVIERLAVIAAREVDDVTATGGRWSALPLVASTLPSATAKVAGGRARIAVEVAARWPLSATDVAVRVRDHVRAQVSWLAGIDVDAVDVTIADIVPGETASRRVS